MTTLRLWRLLHRPGTYDASGRTATLAVVAFAAATAIFLTVLGGVHAFLWRASPDHTPGCLMNEQACAPGAVEAWSHRLVDPHDPAQYAATYVLFAAFACVLAAVSCGVMQAGSVIDQADEYRMLMLEGTDVKTLNRARFIEVLTPLTTVVVVAGTCSLLLMWPLFAQLMTQPGTLVMFAGGVAACFALVAVGALAANRVAAGITVTGLRRDD